MADAGRFGGCFTGRPSITNLHTSSNRSTGTDPAGQVLQKASRRQMQHFYVLYPPLREVRWPGIFRRKETAVSHAGYFRRDPKLSRRYLEEKADGFRVDFPINCNNPARRAAGVGGQPGIRTSTGITFATAPQLA